MAQLSESSKADLPPTTVTEAMTDRLGSGQALWHSTMESCVEASLRHDAAHDPTYAATSALLESILAMTTGDSSAQGQMNHLLALTRSRQQRPQDALPLAQRAHNQLLAQEYDATLRRLQNELLNITLARATGDTALAETHCLNIMSYNWANVEDYPKLEAMRECYIEAARQLIQLRHGKLKALQNIYFIPAVSEELQPLLDEAIQAAR